MVIVVTTITLLQVLTSYVTYRSSRAKRVIDGDIAEETRLEGIGSFADVRWGILESNGSFSFIKNDNGN